MRDSTSHCHKQINQTKNKQRKTFEQMDLIDYIEYLTTTEYMFFSAAYGTHILSHKTCLSKYKKIQSIPHILSNHSTVKLETNGKRNLRNYANTQKLNNTLLNNQWVTDEIKEEICSYNQANGGSITYWYLWGTIKAVLRGKFIPVKSKNELR